MDDYHEFRRDFDAEIESWRQYWSPGYVSITLGGVGAIGASGADAGTPAKAVASTSTVGGVTPPPPSFNPMTEFFLQLRKNYQGVRTDKLRSLTDFERKTSESLRKAYSRMRRLISVTQGVTEAQAVQCWYRILDRDLRRRVRDVTLMHDSSPTLAYVFALSEKIELNMAEERVVTVGFSANPTTSSIA